MRLLKQFLIANPSDFVTKVWISGKAIKDFLLIYKHEPDCY